MTAQRSSSSPSTMSSACDGAASATTPSSSGPDGDNVTSRIALRGTRDRTVRHDRAHPEGRPSVRHERKRLVRRAVLCGGNVLAMRRLVEREPERLRPPTSDRTTSNFPKGPSPRGAVRAPCSGSGCPVAGVADDDPEGGNPQAQGVEHQCDEEVAPRLAQRTGSRPPGGAVPGRAPRRRGWAAPRWAARRTAGCSRHGAAARTAPRDSTRGSGPGLRTTAQRTRTSVVLGRELLAVLDAPTAEAGALLGRWLREELEGPS